MHFWQAISGFVGIFQTPPIHLNISNRDSYKKKKKKISLQTLQLQIEYSWLAVQLMHYVNEERTLIKTQQWQFNCVEHCAQYIDDIQL